MEAASKNIQKVPKIVTQIGGAEKVRLVLAAIVVGAICGFLTFLLKYSINTLAGLLTSDLVAERMNLRFFIFPIFAIFLPSLYQYFIKQDLANGTSQLDKRVSNHRYRLGVKNIYRPLIGCFLTLAFGGSAGAEGPSAYSGSAVGNLVRRKFKLPPSASKILLACGAAAGTAGVFMAPVGGIFFTIEVLQMSFSFMSLTALTAASLTSFTIASFLSGFHWSLAFDFQAPFGPEMLLPIVIMSAICGVYSVYYNASRKFIGSHLSKIKNRWLKNLAAGVGLALLIFLMPSMFGEGYDGIAEVLRGEGARLFDYSMLYHLMLNRDNLLFGIALLILMKGMAVSATNNGGGIAGEFAPTLFVGALCGFLFVEVCNRFLGASLPYEQFALVGMAAVMGGAKRAPLMATFLVGEFTLTYNYIPFYLIATGVSIVVAHYIRKHCMCRQKSKI